MVAFNNSEDVAVATKFLYVWHCNSFMTVHGGTELRILSCMKVSGYLWLLALNIL
jgi:hypothetical protein